MTAKKRCGLRSVPPLFRVFANGVHAAPQEWRRHYKEAALLYGRVAGRLTWSVNARSLRSLALGSVVSLRSPPSAFRSLRSFSAAALPALATLRPNALRRSTSARSSARSARSFLRFTPKRKAVFSRKKSVQGERTFFPKMAYLVFVPPPLHKNKICKKVLYITRSYGAFFIPPPLATGNAP